MNIINLKRVRNLSNVCIRRTDAALVINREQTELKDIANLYLNFEPIEYDENLDEEDLALCFSYTDVESLVDFLDRIANKRTLFIVCDNDSIYWSLLVILYSFKGIPATECVYLATRELPEAIPCAWMIYLYDAFTNNLGRLTEEVENYIITKKTFDRFANCIIGKW